MRVAILVIVTASLLAADAPREDAAAKDQRLMQGTWMPIVGVKNGEERERDDLEKVRFIITGDRLAIRDPRLGNEDSSFRLDASKTPREIDLRIPESTEVVRGIYALDGDELKFCWAEPDRKRPTDFTARKRSHRLLLVLKRVK